MKKQIQPTKRPHLFRRAFYLLFVSVCVIPFTLAQRNATEHDNASKRLMGVGNVLPATVIVVTNTNDSGPGSLRNALAIARDGDTIDATGISGAILLTSGELQITHAVTIYGPGPGNLAVIGSATFRVFDNLTSGVTISGIFITGGSAPGDNGGGILNEGGNFATLRLSNCIVAGNSANFGGGIFNLNGTLTVNKCTINGNGAAFSGGGIANSAFDAAATLIITRSTISFNFAHDGGGITTGAGGSGLAVASVIVSNSTFGVNGATGNGGAIANAAHVGQFARVRITHSTISDNGAGANGDSIYNEGAAEFEIGSTILKLGQGIFGENIFNGGRATSLGYNLSNDNAAGILTGPGDQINTDPLLGPLQDYGGPTDTYALLPGSPAIDTGDPSFTPPPLFDQRGPNFYRVMNGRIDIGSFEVRAGGRPTPTPTATPTG